MGGKGQVNGQEAEAKAALARNEELFKALEGGKEIQAGACGMSVEIFHETHEPEARSTGWHTHELWHELSLMRKGSMEYKIKDKSVSISAERGDIVLIPAGVKHCRVCSEPGSIISGFQIGAGRGSGGRMESAAIDEAIEARGFHAQGSQALAEAFTRLQEELAGDRPLKGMKLNALVKELLAELLRAAIPEAFGKNEAARDGAEAGERLSRRIEAYVEENLARSLSLAEIGAACGVSARHANRVFAKSRGLPLGKRVTELRMKAAKSELEAGGRQVKEVAGALGYKDVSHFIRLFKKAYGRTPSETGRGERRGTDSGEL